MISIYCDGGCLSNGTSNAQTYGSYAINGEIYRTNLYARTNNEAEYLILIEALTEVRKRGYIGLRVKTDSQLVVNQALGRWKIKKVELRPMCVRLQELMRETQASLEWVPREEIVAVLGH